VYIRGAKSRARTVVQATVILHLHLQVFAALDFKRLVYIRGAKGRARTVVQATRYGD